MLCRSLIFALILAVFVGGRDAAAQATIVVDSGTTFQTIDGLGCNLPLAWGDGVGGVVDLKAMTGPIQQTIFDLLFGSSGAGLSMLRMEFSAGDFYTIRPAYTIEPTSPGAPGNSPAYQWDGDANWSIYQSQQARSRGVFYILGGSFTAPSFMKDNNSVNNGGHLCGSSDASACPSGYDWRQAYANWLVKNVQSWASSGVTIDYVGPMNEPDHTASYQSMIMDYANTTSFLKILGPTIAGATLSTKIACCDSAGVSGGFFYQQSNLADPIARPYLTVAGAHGYAGNVGSYADANSYGKHTWQTENSYIADTWNTLYNPGSGSGNGEGWADTIHYHFVNGGSAYFSWMGAWSHTDNEDLIRLFNSTTYQVSARLWVMGNWARFARPNAVRIGATASDGMMSATAFRNVDGSRALVVVNHNSSSSSLTISGLAGSSKMTPYFTNDSSGLVQQSDVPLTGGAATVTIPGVSTVTYAAALDTGGRIRRLGR